LRIMFWNGAYIASFGSIFPTEDIVSLIPQDEADVAILEEPEHLNWFRVPSTPQSSSTSTQPDKDDDSSSNKSASSGGKDKAEEEKNRLGWSHKFNHVVGILHTNYAAYVKQYGGMGTSAIAAPALNGLSSLVCKAYCRRLIRLSATLPSFQPAEEVTCNVHGVRQEFLDTLPPKIAQKKQKQQSSDDDGDDDPPAKVYFIGKLIWAKVQSFEASEMKRQFVCVDC